MEYLDGGSPAKCPEDEAVSIVMQVADALHLIHEEQVLHLDLKPDNIVLKINERGESYPVLIDFGISKHFDSKGRPTSSLNAKGASPGYAPQEQYAGVNEFSPKYDIYALGAVLYYLCTGKNPPDAFKISPNQQELRRELTGKVSANVEKAILNAMKPSAMERTANINQFSLELDEASFCTKPRKEAQLLVNNNLCTAYGSNIHSYQGGYGAGFIGENVIFTICEVAIGINIDQQASGIATREIISTFIDTPKKMWNKGLIVVAIKNAHSAIYKELITNSHNTVMKITISTLMITPEGAFLANIGHINGHHVKGILKTIRSFHDTISVNIFSKIFKPQEQNRTRLLSRISSGVRENVMLTELVMKRIRYKRGDTFVICHDNLWNIISENKRLALYKNAKTQQEKAMFLKKSVNNIICENDKEYDPGSLIIIGINKNSKKQYNLFEILKNRCLKKRIIEAAV